MESIAKSMHVFGPGAYLYPVYGAAEFSQGFARLAAVHGATYILRQPDYNLKTWEKDQNFTFNLHANENEFQGSGQENDINHMEVAFERLVTSKSYVEGFPPRYHFSSPKINIYTGDVIFPLSNWQIRILKANLIPKFL